MFRNLNGGLIAILSLILVSCAARVIYTYNNVNYESPEPAIAAHKSECDAIVSRITPTSHPVGGSAIIFLPSKENLKKIIVLVSKGKEPSQESKDKIRDFTATMLLDDFRAYGDALEKRRIFDRVAIAHNDDPETVSFNEDTALLRLIKDGESQWFMKKKKSNLSELIPIERISAALPPEQRLIIWLDNVEKAAKNH